jgi:hypothetical protein
MSDSPRLSEELENQIEAECDEILSRDDAKEKELWHYTTAEGALGIVSKNEIWATHYGFTNDASEIRIGEEVVCKVVAALAEREEDADRKRLFAILARLFPDHVLSSKADMFVASFTEAYNDLVQWSGYGHRGLGYALKINVRSPEAPPETTRLGGVLTKVEYNVDRFVERASSLLLLYASIFDKYKANGPAVESFLGVCMLRECAAQSLRLKHPAFEHEAEWRLVALALRQEETADIAQLRPRADVGLVPYVALALGEKPLRALVVGPVHADKEAQRLAAARLLLEKYGYDMSLAKLSGIPFRGDPLQAR